MKDYPTGNRNNKTSEPSYGSGEKGNTTLKAVSRLLKSAITMSMLLAALVSVFVIWIRSNGQLQRLELSAYDSYLRLHASISSEQSPITLVAITEADIQRLKQWPLSDATLAQLLKIILGHQPRAIGIDIFRDIPIPPGSQELTELFSDNQKIVTVLKLGDEKNTGVAHPYMLKDTNLAGFSDIIIDEDSLSRRGLFYMDDGKTVFSSFALLLSQAYLKADNIIPMPDPLNPEHLRLGKTTFVPFKPNVGGYVRADAGGYQFLLDFQSRPFKTISLTDILSGNFDPGLIRDRVIIIGSMAESVKDLFFIPLNNISYLKGMIYGIELHAYITGQIIQAALHGKSPMSSIPEHYKWLWILLWGLAGGAFGLWIRSLLRFSIITILGLSALITTTYLLFKAGLWIPAVPPGLSWMVSLALVTAYLSYREKADRKALMELFSKHVSKEIADFIWLERESLMQNGRLKPKKLTATVLFSDIKGFTTISERLEPAELMNWLNEYMEAMSPVVITNRGIISKYSGDAIMAIFGVPVAAEDEETLGRDAGNAVRCALGMEKELEKLNTKWEDRGMPAINIRVGIYTGKLVAGGIGNAQRMEYTVIGDTVNIASRLESFDKDFNDPELEGRCCRILIGESTFKLLGNEFRAKKIGEVSLKGKDEKITAYLAGRNQ